MAEVLLPGLGIAGYRSFGTARIQRIGPMAGVHLLAGPNNAGKSNVLYLAKAALDALKGGGQGALQLKDSDIPRGVSSPEARRLRVSVGCAVPEDRWESLVGSNRRVQRAIRDGLAEEMVSGYEPEAIWFDFEYGPRDTSWGPAPEQVKRLGERLSQDREMYRYASQLANNSGNSETVALHFVVWLANALDPRQALPPVEPIGAFRRIASATGAEGESEFDGFGLRERLAALQSPGYGNPEDRDRFEQINEFIRTLFGDPRAQMEIPYDREQPILVHHEGQRLPLENYGTGLHEVIILAAAATALERTLVCIEEPEIHLHPTLQRKLLRYLAEKTTNQYLIATHSAALLDAERASITAVHLQDGCSRLSPVIEPTEVAEISFALGARASDLVQANSVVWVEGPSDRTYLRAWIKRLAPELTEGVHYSVMFYGGSSLAHLSANDPAVDEFVSLPRINRNFAVVIDSDRRKAHADVNATKRRIRKEVRKLAGDDSVWITQGYTIENYVPPTVLRKAVKKIHPSATFRWGGARLRNPLAGDGIRDKAAIAAEAISGWPYDDWPLDLKPRVEALVSMIRTANDLPH